MKIDGKAINEKIAEFLKQEIAKQNHKPSLGIFCVGSDPASLSFIKAKKNFGEKCGFVVNVLKVEDTESLEFIKKSFTLFQAENHAVIVQLPLPANFKNNTAEILSLIKEEKDVDNLNNGFFVAPIVLALQKVLQEVGDKNLQQLTFGVVGLGQVVGMPIKKFLDENNYKVATIARGEEEKMKSCDVLISGVGEPFLIKKESIKEGAVLIDYGCSFVTRDDGTISVCGDFDQACFEKASYYTPVPGCMGPLVVASLFENVLESFKRKSE